MNHPNPSGTPLPIIHDDIGPFLNIPTPPEWPMCPLVHKTLMQFSQYERALENARSQLRLWMCDPIIYSHTTRYVNYATYFVFSVGGIPPLVGLTWPRDLVELVLAFTIRHRGETTIPDLRAECNMFPHLKPGSDYFIHIGAIDFRIECQGKDDHYSTFFERCVSLADTYWPAHD
jgi:hypothetical protein